MKKYTLYQGNIFDQPVKFTYAGFDFTDCVIECQIRTKALSPEIIHTFVITPDFSVPEEVSFRLQMTSAESQAIKINDYVGDLKISRVSPAYGPYTVASFCLNVVKPITRNF
jgi:hypothetical protein